MKFVVTISNGLKRALIEAGGSGEKIHVVPDAADNTNYANHRDKRSIRENLGMPVKSPTAVYTGGAAPGKGVDILIKSATTLPEIEFFLVGVQENDLGSTSNTSYPPNIHFISRVDPAKAAEYQMASDVLLLPQSSPQSQSPLKLYEYIAAGKPIVATDLEPVREVLKHRHSALLAKPGSPKSFAHEISVCVSNRKLRQVLVANAREQVGNWSWEQRGQRIAYLVRDQM